MLPQFLLSASPDAIANALRSKEGGEWRNAIGAWIEQTVSVQSCVPESAARWRPVVADAMRFVFSRLSEDRLAIKIAEQLRIPLETPPERRLLLLVSKMPGLQKLGQVLARNSRLAPNVRQALAELENGMSDVTAEQVKTILQSELGDRLGHYGVIVDATILSEASVSAVIGFAWNTPERERQRGVFKVLKPHIPACFAEDIRLLEELAAHLGIRDAEEIIGEALLLLRHELDFPKERQALAGAARMYRSSIGIRVPRVIDPLCTTTITAMSEECGVKVTDACRRSIVRRERIAEQLVEAIVAVPLLCGDRNAVFHGDPHAGNLLYDEVNRELIMLDWALTDRLTLGERRALILLAVMTGRRKTAEVIAAIEQLGRGRHKRLIRGEVEEYFKALPEGYQPGALDAMRLLDRLAVKGLRFPAALFLFRKVLFTLDGVLRDVADSNLRMDHVIARVFFTRCIASCGLLHAPMRLADFGSALNAFSPIDFGRVSRDWKPSPKKRLRRPAKPLPPVRRPR